MKKLIVTFNVEKDFNFNPPPSLESFRYAAYRWECDFLEIKVLDTPKWTEVGRFLTLERFSNYDAILMLDYDTVIVGDAPNIFDLYFNTEKISLVKDGNPGREDESFAFDNDLYKNQIVKRISEIDDSISLFESLLFNFNKNTYFDNYVNCGVMLGSPNKFKELFNLIINFGKNSFLKLEEKSPIFEQNIFNAIVNAYNFPIDFIPNEWNWIAPDCYGSSWNKFSNKQKCAYIYHFAGTDSSKHWWTTMDWWK